MSSAGLVDAIVASSTDMDLESARQLKEEAVTRFVAPSGATSFASRRLAAFGSVMLGTLTKSADPLHTPRLGRGRPAHIGLGVALGRDGDCKLAVRYPWRDRSRAPHLQALKDLAGGEIDVEWSGPITAQTAPPLWCRARLRPIQIGASVAHKDVGAGTICAFVTRGEGPPEVLSCNHVLANCDRAAPDDPILQPGPIDGGISTDVIGRLSASVPLDRTGGTNTVDCAIASLATGVTAKHSDLVGYGQLQGVVAPSWFGSEAVGEPVAKLGRTSGATTGRVGVISFTQRIFYPGFGRCIFDELIEVTAESGPFSSAGDSGSLVFTSAEPRGVGMVIGGTGTASYITRLDSVLSRLGANLVL